MNALIRKNLKKMLHAYNFQLDELDFDEKQKTIQFLGLFDITYSFLINLGSLIVIPILQAIIPQTADAMDFASELDVASIISPD